MLFPFMLLWGVIGVVVGFIASKVVNLRGDSPAGGIGVSALAAMLCGLVWNVSSGHGLAGWTVWSCAAAAVGGLIGVTIWHAIRSRYVSRAHATTRRSY